MAFKLAELFVQFSAQGADKLKDTLTQVKQQMELLKKATEFFGADAVNQFKNKLAQVNEQMGLLKKATEFVSTDAIKKFDELGKGLQRIDKATNSGAKLQAVAAAIEAVAKLKKELAGAQVIEFGLGSEGAAKAALALEDLQKQLAVANKEAKGEAGKLFLKGIEEVGKAANKALLALTGSLGGFVTAGLLGTTMGERLTLQMSLLSREIAQVFLPVLEFVSRKLQDLTDWFRSLSGEQQNSLMKWAIWTAGASAFLSVLPKIIAAVDLLNKSLKAMATTQAFLAAISGVGLVKLGIGLAAAGGTAYALSKITDSLDKGGGRQELARSGGSYSSIQDSFRQIQLAALRQDVGGTIEQKQLTAQERIASATESTRDQLTRLKPALGR